MFSANNAPGKSEKQRIWELEEQLEDEQHAHRKTKFALRNAQENMDQNDLLKALMAENEELKKALKTKDERLEEKTRTLKKLKNKLTKTKTQKEASVEELKKEVQGLQKLNKGLIENFQSKRNELEGQLKQQTEEARDLRQRYSNLERLNNVALESMRVLETEKAGLKIEVQRQSYEARLEEYNEEVDRLRRTKKRVVDWSRFCTQDYKYVIDRLIKVLEERSLEGDAEEVKKLKEEKQKMWDEYCWWDNYQFFSCTLSEAFRAMQSMKSSPVSKTLLISNRDDLQCLEGSFENQSMKLEGPQWKEWVKEEQESVYFDKWEKMIEEAEERINGQ